MDMFKYVKERPDGVTEQMLSTEHMLYVWEAAESLQIDESLLEQELIRICKNQPKYYYITREGKKLRCYEIKDVFEAAHHIITHERS